MRIPELLSIHCTRSHGEKYVRTFKGPGLGEILGKYNYVVRLHSMHDCDPHPLVDAFVLRSCVYCAQQQASLIIRTGLRYCQLYTQIFTI